MEKKISPTCFDKTAVFTQYRQNKWDIFSNFLKPIQKSWTLHRTFVLANFEEKNSSA